MNFNKTLITLVLTSLLGACGGNDGSGGGLQGPGEGGGGGGGEGGGGGAGGGSTTNVSYIPLMVFESFKDYSGFSADNLFSLYEPIPYTTSYLINPVNAQTLLPVTTATVGDFSMTVNEIPADSAENFPLLQKVLGIKTYLRTALVFDLSDSSGAVDMTALVNAAKAYVDQAGRHTNSTIREQEFMVWAFGTEVEAKLPRFTRDVTAINSALDQVLEDFDEKTLGSSTNLHHAVVEVVGRYVKAPYDFSDVDYKDPNGDGIYNGDGGDEYDFDGDGRPDLDQDGDYDGDADGFITANDLADFASEDGIITTQIAIFSSGPDTGLRFTKEEMARAIKSQSFVRYDQSTEDASDFSYLEKAVFYYVLGAEDDAYEHLAAKAAAVVPLNGSYAFAGDLIGRQIQAMNQRIDLSNPHLMRFAFRPRYKGNYTQVFKSKAGSGYNYSLTREYKLAEDEIIFGSPEEMVADGFLDSLVEITGPNGEYLSAAQADFDDVRVFVPATRWSIESYEPSDYTWLAGPGITGSVDDSTGRYTVTALADDNRQLTLTNVARGETTTITLNR